MLKEGDTVPDFTLDGVSIGGTTGAVSLSDFEGKNIVLYFYPADKEVVCKDDSCVFRDRLNIVANAIVVGVSPDDIKTHVEFKKKCFVNFVLLCDEDHKIAEMFDAWDSENKATYRYTFLLNGDRKIVKVWHDEDIADYVV